MNIGSFNLEPVSFVQCDNFVKCFTIVNTKYLQSISCHDSKLISGILASGSFFLISILFHLMQAIIKQIIKLRTKIELSLASNACNV